MRIALLPSRLFPVVVGNDASLPRRFRHDLRLQNRWTGASFRHARSEDAKVADRRPKLRLGEMHARLFLPCNFRGIYYNKLCSH
jgi:hypothetical protein